MKDTERDDPLGESSDRLKETMRNVDAISARIKRLLEARDQPAEERKDAAP